MRTTVDIPDPVYRALKTRAATRGKTVKSEILESVTEHLTRSAASRTNRRLSAPIVDSGEPGSLKLDNESIYDLIYFP